MWQKIVAYLKAGVLESIKKWVKVFFWVALSSVATLVLQAVTGITFNDFTYTVPTLDMTISVTAEMQNLALLAFVNGALVGFVNWVKTNADKCKEEVGQ